MRVGLRYKQRFSSRQFQAVAFPEKNSDKQGIGQNHDEVEPNNFCRRCDTYKETVGMCPCTGRDSNRRALTIQLVR
jgi:hypothetical protein